MLADQLQQQRSLSNNEAAKDKAIVDVIIKKNADDIERDRQNKQAYRMKLQTINCERNAQALSLAQIEKNER